MPELPVSRARFLAAIAFVLCAWLGTEHARAQTMLGVGQPLSTRSGGERGGELYAFLGLAGDELLLTLTHGAAATLTVYGTDGAPLVGTEGPGALQLPVKLPMDGVYLVGVSLQPGGAWADRRKVPGFNLFYADIEADAKARLAAWRAR